MRFALVAIAFLSLAPIAAAQSSNGWFGATVADTELASIAILEGPKSGTWLDTFAYEDRDDDGNWSEGDQLFLVPERDGTEKVSAGDIQLLGTKRGTEAPDASFGNILTVVGGVELVRIQNLNGRADIDGDKLWIDVNDDGNITKEEPELLSGTLAAQNTTTTALLTSFPGAQFSTLDLDDDGKHTEGDAVLLHLRSGAYPRPDDVPVKSGDSDWKFGVPLQGTDLGVLPRLEEPSSIGARIRACYLDDNDDGKFQSQEFLYLHYGNSGEVATGDLQVAPQLKEVTSSTAQRGEGLDCDNWSLTDDIRFLDANANTRLDPSEVLYLSGDDKLGSGDARLFGPAAAAGPTSGDDAWGKTIRELPSTAQVMVLDNIGLGAFQTRDILVIDVDGDERLSPPDRWWPRPSADNGGDGVLSKTPRGRLPFTDSTTYKLPDELCVVDEADWDPADGPAPLYLHSSARGAKLAAGDIGLYEPRLTTDVVGFVLDPGTPVIGERLDCDTYSLADIGFLDEDNDGRVADDELLVIAADDELEEGDLVLDESLRVLKSSSELLGEEVTFLELDGERIVTQDTNGNGAQDRNDTLFLDLEVDDAGEGYVSGADLVLSVNTKTTFNETYFKPPATPTPTTTPPANTTTPVPTNATVTSVPVGGPQGSSPGAKAVGVPGPGLVLVLIALVGTVAGGRRLRRSP